jgi:8-oxo-dGTP pyrophosphatase MutT (NUDIX family)
LLATNIRLESFLECSGVVAFAVMVESRKKPGAKRVQYAALPYRRKGKSPTEVLLVTSRETGRWIIPKGWPAKGKAPHKSAAREAREEAGVVGTVKRRSLGAFSYKKRLKSGKVVACEVQVFALKVKRQEARWLEKGERKLKWLPRTKAAKKVGDDVLGTIIRTLNKRRKRSGPRPRATPRDRSH